MNSMRIVLQKVTQASVQVASKTVGHIGHGFLLFLGVTHDDTEKDADYLIEKILKLRLFAAEGSDSFMDKNIVETGGSLLIVSQFTLYGDCKKGTRPSFTDAAKPDHALMLYEYFVSTARAKGIIVETGIFAAHMEVTLTNDGPITLLLDSK